MSIFIEETDYPEVRAELDIGLTPSALPDDVIGSNQHAGRADAWVLSINADAESATGAEALAIKSGAIYYCAWLLFDKVQRNDAMKNGALSFSREKIDPERRRNELYNKAVYQMTGKKDGRQRPFVRSTACVS